MEIATNSFNENNVANSKQTIDKNIGTYIADCYVLYNCTTHIPISNVLLL